MFSSSISAAWSLALVAGMTGLGGMPVEAQEWGWQEIAVSGPPARHSHAMVYDSARRVVVLFGGLAGDERDSELFGVISYYAP